LISGLSGSDAISLLPEGTFARKPAIEADFPHSRTQSQNSVSVKDEHLRVCSPWDNVGEYSRLTIIVSAIARQITNERSGKRIRLSSLCNKCEGVFLA
jgi:hypothetical protein